MADFGAPVAQNVNVNPNGGIQTLSGLLQLQQQRQQLQTQTAEAYQATQTATERRALAQIPWKSFQNDDGSFDMDKVSNAALSVAPTTGQDFVTRFAQMAEGGAATKKAYYSLNQDYQNSIRSTLGAWAGDPDSNLADLAKQRDILVDNAPKSSKAAVAQLMDHTLGIMSAPNLMDGSPKTVQQQKQQALMYSRAGLGPSEVVGAGGTSTPATGTTVGPSGQLVGTAQSRTTGTVSPAGGGVSLGLSPQQLAQTITLPNGQVTTLGAFLGKSISGGGSGGGSATPAQPAPHGGRTDAGVQLTAANDPNRPGANAPKASQDSWSASVAQANKDVSDARTADQYGNNMAVAEQIRRLSGETNTGPGTPEFTRLMGMLTSRFGGSQGVTNTQTLESFLDRQASSLRTGMNLPATNAGEEQARTIGGNIGMQGGALQAKNSYNEALAQGLHDYRTGLDHVEGFSGNASPTAVNRFKSAWAANFDPVAYEWKLAMSRGDKQAANEIASRLSPEQRQAMQQKGRNLDLLTQGKLPQ